MMSLSDSTGKRPFRVVVVGAGVQLECLEAVQNACAEMTVSYTRDPDGKAITARKLFDEIVKGYAKLLSYV